MAETKTDTASTPEPKFTPDYGVATLAVWGLAGIFIGCIILFINDIVSKDTNTVFHELKYEPRVYADKIINHSLDSFNDLLIAKKALIAKNDSFIARNEKISQKTKIDDSIILELKKSNAKIIAEKEVDTLKIKQLSVFSSYYKDMSIADTSSFDKLNKLLHFSITPDSIYLWDSIFNENPNATFSATCFLKDPELKVTEKIGTNVVFKPIRYKKDVTFIAKYPAAGIWVLMILVFCSFCLICCVSAVYNTSKAAGIFEDESLPQPDRWSYIKILLITVFCFGLIILIWNKSFFDDSVVKNIFFMKGMISRLNIIITIGIVAGSFCIAGFIYTASMLSVFAKPLVDIRKEIDKKEFSIKEKENKNTADPNQTAANPTEKADLVTQQAEEAKKKIIFDKLASVFQSYFTMAAIILCLSVICTGTLFETINSLDFTKLLISDWGYSPTRSEFIYFYGALFTIILLLVYVPAKIKFSEVAVWKTESATPKTWKEIITNPFGQLKGILVATSPLLVSLVQSLIDTLFS